MRILIFSDTHGSIQSAYYAIQNTPDVDAIIHAGDVDRDADKLSELFPNIPVYAVTGNNDFFPSYPFELDVTLGGKRIYITHGHRLGVKSGMSGLYRLADENDYDLIIYGHTHTANADYRGKSIILNPGAMTYGRKSYAVAETENGILKTSIIEV